ncbi:MAG TPA: glycine oxidase ThiO [Thermoanaerobaculia bacterium]|nr:glycine oxidase ThiO [Thermoanaerobaculia bacterium]
MTHPDVLVLGGGIIGLACARELALRGLRVEVVERLPAGAEASLASAGMLSPLGEWAAAGPFFDACRASRDLWGPWVAALKSETGLGVDYDTSGALLVALDEEDEAELDRTAFLARKLGEPAGEIELPALRQWVPDITPQVRRALHLPGEHRVDNVQVCAALAQAVRKLGVLIHYDSEAEQVERRPEGTVLVSGNHWRKEARLLVLAAGAWSGHIPELPPLPVRPVRGQIVLLGGIEWPWSGSVRRSTSYVVRRGPTGLLVGSTLEEAGFNKHNTVEGVEDLLAFVRRLLPGIGNARLETVWAGLRPGTADDLPILGPLPGWPVIVATGHYRNGILLAPWTAREVARLAFVEDEAEVPAFSPKRFLKRA